MKWDTGSVCITPSSQPVILALTVAPVMVILLMTPLPRQNLRPAAPWAVTLALEGVLIPSVSIQFNPSTISHATIATENFMDYSVDSCMTKFSPGQIARLQAQVRTFRGINI